MKTTFAMILSICFVASCGTADDDPTLSVAPDRSAVNASGENNDGGKISLTIDGASHSATVKCHVFEEGNLRFLSDNFGAADDDGDGLIITGVESLDGHLQLVVTMNGVVLRSERLNSFQREENGASGSGKLRMDGDSTNLVDVDVSVTC